MTVAAQRYKILANMFKRAIRNPTRLARWGISHDEKQSEGTDQDLLELIFLSPRDPGKQNWPAWEIPAYDFVSSRLFRFWKGEKKPDK